MLFLAFGRLVLNFICCC